MFGPYTPTLLALLTRRSKLLQLKTLRPAAPGESAAAVARKLCDRKTAIITGAASGIGAALARALASAGCSRLVLSDIAWRDADGSPVDADRHTLVSSLRDQGADVLPLVSDVGSRDSILEMRDQAMTAFGAPHFLFNNAGVGMPGVLSATEEVCR